MSKERIQLIEDVDRNFSVSDIVTVAVKPKGFNLWCKLPYPKHPNGCPNFGHRADCPPNMPYFLDVYKPEVKVAALEFNFDEYLSFRRRNHPNWTEKALRNPRHFQNHLDANLEREIKKIGEHGTLENFVPVYTSEAMGVNMHLTCQRAGVILQWPPKDVMYRIALLAQPL